MPSRRSRPGSTRSRRINRSSRARATIEFRRLSRCFAPAAICRKVAEAVHTGKHEIEIWGDGKQSRSFMYIDDCVRGTIEILNGPRIEPINLGSAELVTIDQLVDIVEDIAGIKLERNYDLSAPKGVRGRNSDNTLIQELLGWEPQIGLRDGLESTYSWIRDQVAASVATR